MLIVYLPAIKNKTPIGVSLMIHCVMNIMTKSMAAKKSRMMFAASPTHAMPRPNTMEQTIKPRMFEPFIHFSSVSKTDSLQIKSIGLKKY